MGGGGIQKRNFFSFEFIRSVCISIECYVHFVMSHNVGCRFYVCSGFPHRLIEDLHDLVYPPRKQKGIPAKVSRSKDHNYKLRVEIL